MVNRDSLSTRHHHGDYLLIAEEPVPRVRDRPPRSGLRLRSDEAGAGELSPGAPVESRPLVGCEVPDDLRHHRRTHCVPE